MRSSFSISLPESRVPHTDTSMAKLIDKEFRKAMTFIANYS
jgi:hypothetical protein